MKSVTTSLALPSLYDLTLAQLETLLDSWQEPAYRARQVWHWLYQRLVTSFDEMTDLPLRLRARLKEHFALGRLTPIAEQHSADGWTRKWLFQLPDGSQIETVLMEYDGERRTVCISSQAGCAMACSFCATGQMGFVRNLRSGEIVEQVLWAARALGDERLSNVVYMGMGEPFANYASVMESIHRLTTPASEGGLGLGARKITVSTVGLVPGIRRFAEEGGQVNLAISLHAATDELRTKLVPINARYPLHELVRAAREYIERTNRRLSFEWALIEHVNDTLEQAQALVELVRQTNPRPGVNLVHVNLIPLNPTDGYSGRAPQVARRQAFVNVLKRAGIPCTLRVRRGIDIAAGCGQLRARHKKNG
ncbi:MAG: 23S rRNA (adenine(2503)-C(2))-methyltransferase RlmN [Thermoflexales bacterium]|nr:23S rRNA (adenine(2503)-C(2))-methyltransferase RlmN [Thermoflexales bacterium]MDW8053758.1 23S rRNA (adenine(2503)-C(2))-methyltransferase RlmN [Anaerolineae bacterium]MDW8292986.1 23S rRNA (adenine(2503)-C(2))-methyltransferase RlmN [Anaerolineae bacterium]